MNETVDDPSVPSNRDQLEQLIKQAKARSRIGHPSRVTGNARSLMKHVHSSQLAEQARAWGQIDPMGQLTDQTRAWIKGDHLTQLAEQARAWSQIDPRSQLTDKTRAWIKGDHLTQLAEQARAWSQVDPRSQLTDKIRAWIKGDHLTQLAEQARAWSQIDPRSQLTDKTRAWIKGDHLSQLADQAKAWLTGDHIEFARQTIPQDLTFKALLGELASRSSEIVEAPIPMSGLKLVSAEETESVSVGDMYVADISPGRNAKPTLSGIPTWLLYLWLCIAPVLEVLTHWEDFRQGLVDINERVPQTYSFASLRRFISSNLAGKPGDIRLVTGSDVRLRAAPGMKSAVLLTLPKYAAVVVLEKEDRTWLYVSYEHDGFLIDGYVSTKFLRKVRK
jgi:uncharacterized protein YifN (PemK superfamily)